MSDRSGIKANKTTQVLEYVDRGLDHYGATTKQVVYYNLETNFKLAKGDILKHPEKFVQSIREMFGPGSRSIEQVIILEMQTSSELKDLDRSDLVTALKQARAYYQRQS